MAASPRTAAPSPAPSVATTVPFGQPAWVADELPPKYAELANRIAAIQQEAHQFEKVAAVLWQTGAPLKTAVHDVFVAMGFEAELQPPGASHDVTVPLEGGARLLVEVVADTQGLTRKSPEIAQVLRALQEDAKDRDRVVLVSNAHPDVPRSSRRDEPVAPDALRLIQGMGANLVSSSVLYGLWRYSLDDPKGARESILKLHAQDGGLFR